MTVTTTPHLDADTAEKLKGFFKQVIHTNRPILTVTRVGILVQHDSNATPAQSQGILQKHFDDYMASGTIHTNGTHQEKVFQETMVAAIGRMIGNSQSPLPKQEAQELIDWALANQLIDSNSINASLHRPLPSKDTPNTLLNVAINEGFTSLARQLLENGAQITEQPQTLDGATSLRHAIAIASQEIIETLLGNGIRPTMTDLQYACELVPHKDSTHKGIDSNDHRMSDDFPNTSVYAVKQTHVIDLLIQHMSNFDFLQNPEFRKAAGEDAVMRHAIDKMKATRITLSPEDEVDDLLFDKVAFVRGQEGYRNSRVALITFIEKCVEKAQSQLPEAVVNGTTERALAPQPQQQV